MTDPFDLQRFLDAQTPIYPRVLAQGGDQFRPLAVDRRARSPQQDHEGGGVAEVFAEELVAARGLGAGDVERGRVEAVFGAGSDHRQDDQDRGGDSEDRARVAQQERLIPPRALPRGLPTLPAYPPSHGW